MLSLILVALVLANVQDSSACGVRQVSSGLIVGGSAATPGAWPWQVSIRRDYSIGPGNYHTCGGTLINHRYVLTATHCFSGSNVDPADYEIVLGNHRRETTDSTQQSFAVAEVINHSGYVSRTMENDITLLKLATYVNYNDYIQPACLPTKDWPAGTNIWVTGWGDQEVIEALDDEKLQEITVPIIATDICNRATWYSGGVFDNCMFCAGYENGGTDSCQGDSGGPAVVDNVGTHEIIGVTSWGSGCADAKKPGVYTRVHNYLNWIATNTA